MSTYSDRLKDPRWQRRRLEILHRSDFTCEVCEASDKTLHVHHKLYRKGAMPWEYGDHELAALCEDCHAEETKLRERLAAAMADLETSDLEELLGYALGLRAKVEVFGDMDQESRRPDRTWEVLTWYEARGFGLCLLGKMTSLEVYELIDQRPLNHGRVFDISVHGLPSQRKEGQN